MSQQSSTAFSDSDIAHLMTSKEATTYLKEKGIPAKDSTLRTLRHRRHGPTYYLIAGQAMYGRSDLDSYIISCRVDPAPGESRSEHASPGGANERG
jgi:hypothetical protein